MYCLRCSSSLLPEMFAHKFCFSRSFVHVSIKYELWLLFLFFLWLSFCVIQLCTNSIALIMMMMVLQHPNNKDIISQSSQQASYCYSCALLSNNFQFCMLSDSLVMVTWSNLTHYLDIGECCTCTLSKGNLCCKTILTCVLWIQMISSAFSHAVGDNKLDFKLCQWSFLVFKGGNKNMLLFLMLE